MSTSDVLQAAHQVARETLRRKHVRNYSDVVNLHTDSRLIQCADLLGDSRVKNVTNTAIMSNHESVSTLFPAHIPAIVEEYISFVHGLRDTYPRSVADQKNQHTWSWKEDQHVYSATWTVIHPTRPKKTVSDDMPTYRVSIIQHEQKKVTYAWISERYGTECILEWNHPVKHYSFELDDESKETQMLLHCLLPYTTDQSISKHLEYGCNDNLSHKRIRLDVSVCCRRDKHNTSHSVVQHTTLDMTTCDGIASVLGCKPQEIMCVNVKWNFSKTHPLWCKSHEQEWYNIVRLV